MQSNLYAALSAVAVAVLCATMCAASDGDEIPDLPFSIAAWPSRALWKKNLHQLGHVSALSGGTSNGSTYLAALSENSFALLNGADGRALMLQAFGTQREIVFLDFVSGKLLVVTNTGAECIDPGRSEVIAKYAVADGHVADATPTGAACELVLFVVNNNRTTDILLFQTHHVELIHKTSEDVISNGLVMKDGVAIVVFETKGYLNGVTLDHNVHFRAATPSNIVVGPMLFHNEFYTADDSGVIRCYNSSGVVTRTFTFHEPIKRAVVGLAISRDGRTLVATMGRASQTFAAFNRVDGTKIWEHSPPSCATGDLKPVRSCDNNFWKRNSELFDNDTMWFYDDGGSFYQLRTPDGKWEAKLNTWPRPPTVHAPTFASLVAGQYLVFQPHGMAFVCFVDIVGARPKYCFEMEGANPRATAVSALDYAPPVLATDDFTIANVWYDSLPVRDFDPSKAVGQERWAVDMGIPAEAVAYSDLAVCTLSQTAIFLYNPLDGKIRNILPVEALYHAVHYFDVVEQDLILVTDTSITVVPLVNTTGSFTFTTSAIEWAIPAGNGSEILFFRRIGGGDKHEIVHFKDGEAKTIFITEELAVTTPVILRNQIGRVVVFAEANHIAGVQLPEGVQVFRVGSKAAWLGPLRIANHFFMGDDEGNVYQYAPDGTIVFTYKTSMRSQVLDIDVSTDGKIMVVTLRSTMVAAFHLESHEKLYETADVPGGTPRGTLTRIYPSTISDWASHADAWHNDTMWFYDSFSTLFPFDVKKGCFIAEVFEYDTIMELPRAAFAAGMSHIVTQLRRAANTSIVCSIAMDASVLEVCIPAGEERLSGIVWNAKTKDVVVAMRRGKVVDLKAPKITLPPSSP